MKTTRLFAVAVALAVSAVACDTADPTTSSAAPTTAVPPTVETFTGTVAAGSKDVKSFNVLLTGGTLTVTLTAAGPPSSIAMALGVGNFADSTCTLITSVPAQASTAPQLSGAVSAGAYCVVVADSGAQTGPVTYGVTVTHYSDLLAERFCRSGEHLRHAKRLRQIAGDAKIHRFNRARLR